MTPAQIHEAVDVGLSIVGNALGRVEWHEEVRSRPVSLEIEDISDARLELQLAEAEVVLAAVVEVEWLEARRIEHDRLFSHSGLLSRAGEKEAPLTDVVADVHALAVRVERATVSIGVHVESASGNPGMHIHHRRILVSEFRVPATCLEFNAITKGGAKGLVRLPEVAERTGNTVDEVLDLG